MNNKIIFALLFTCFSTSLFSQVEGEVWYKPPFLPFSISWDTDDGFSIKAERSISTPYGTFGLGVSGGLNKKDENTVQVPSNNSKPVYIEVPKYIDKPIFQIRTVEVIKTKIIENKTYILEIRGYKGKASQEFIIKGIDVFLVEVEGKTKIEAREGRVIIDVSESTVNKIMFRGISLGEENESDNINKLCLKYNTTYGMQVQEQSKDITEDYYITEKYRTDYGTIDERSVRKQKITGKELYLTTGGFLVFSQYKDFTKYKVNFEHKRSLIKGYYIDEFQNQPTALYRDILITNKGIGLPIRRMITKKNILGKEKFDDWQDEDHFFQWNEYVSITFNNVDFEGNKQENRIFGHTPYGQTFEVMYGRISGRFNRNYSKFGYSNVELIQFFKELNSTLTKRIK